RGKKTGVTSHLNHRTGCAGSQTAEVSGSARAWYDRRCCPPPRQWPGGRRAAMDSALPPPTGGAHVGSGEPELYYPPELMPDLDKLVSEDGKPVDNVYVERQYKLLTEPLYASWGGPGPGRSFVALVNVGWYHTEGEPALVPDVLLS